MVVVEEREEEDSRTVQILQRELHNSCLALPSWPLLGCNPSREIGRITPDCLPSFPADSDWGTKQATGFAEDPSGLRFRALVVFGCADNLIDPDALEAFLKLSSQ